MYQLPTTVQVDGKEWGITKKGDFRIVLSVFEALNDPELPTLQEKTLAATLLFYQEFNVLEDIMELPVETYQELVEKMFLFINCNQLNVGVNTGRKILDWKQDEQLIMSAINSVARKEVRAEKYVHWFTFMGYYMAIGECPLSTVVSIRDKIARNKKLEKYEKEFRKDNPQYFMIDMRSDTQKKNDELARSLWNSEEQNAGCSSNNQT